MSSNNYLKVVSERRLLRQIAQSRNERELARQEANGGIDWPGAILYAMTALGVVVNLVVFFGGSG